MQNVIPVYYQIMRTIKGWVLNQEFAPGERIPSEHELAHRFNVSRLTVRQSISHLIQEGLLNSKRGEGTFVTHDEELINSFSLEFGGIMDDLLFRQMLKVQMKSVTINRITPSRLIRQKLGLSTKENQVIRIDRVRVLKDKQYNYIVNYLPLNIGVKISRRDLYKRTLLAILEQDLRLKFTEAFQTIEASLADHEVAKRLEVAPGSPILYVERILYNEGHAPVELYQSSYSGDLYKFAFRLNNIREKKGRKWIYHLDLYSRRAG